MGIATTKFTYIEWDGPANTFRKRTAAGVPLPPDPDSVTWWHAASNLKGSHSPQSVQGVTHLGDFDSARYRADVQTNFGVTSSGIYEVLLRPGLAVMPEAYVENYGQSAMKFFEQMLLNSNFDLAFTWNEKESTVGAWTIIVRRSVLGDLPLSLGAGFTLVSTQP